MRKFYIIFTICLIGAVLFGNVGTVRAEGYGDFICQNFQALNINDAGEVIDEDLATDSSATNFVITKRKVITTYPAEGGKYSRETVHHGKWTDSVPSGFSKEGRHTFLVNKSKSGSPFFKIQWGKYGLGTFRNYGVNRNRLMLYKCIKIN
jgi:hypothetical protein